jgi:alkanesulfonate monooxygenase SsuD/methylene tetrahydromethanopterin reductase-like flavin-dependent oxidoreductase (luciferase family)
VGPALGPAPVNALLPSGRVPRRFGILTFAAGPFEETARHWRQAEALGFDDAWVVDVLTYPGVVDYDATTLLAALARETSRIRVGTLVIQIIYRHPVLLAAQAIALDRVSDGRFELGLGAGGAPVDSAAFGVEHWSLRERVNRFGEQLAMLDQLLRGERLDFSGQYYRAEGDPLATPVQRPRPPLTVAAQIPSSLRLAARFADSWNTMGGQPSTASGKPRLSIEKAVEATREQAELFDSYCREIGRDPKTIRRSVLALRTEPVPLTSLDAFDEFVGRYEEIGFDEFIFYWPPLANVRQHEPVSAAQERTLEEIASKRVHTRR